jgi:hypothetical protein
MVSKLLLTAQENFFDAFDGNLDTQVLEYMESYEAIKDGIGAHKTPVEYGAFPTDAYSHTPGFAGVQQPGMTGQVKEDFITRLRELGVDVFNGQVVFNPILLKKSEFLNETKVWSLPTSDITLAENTLGFTFGTVPVIYSLTNVEGLTVEMSDGTTKSFETNKLSKDLSQNLFNRDGEVKLIKVNINSNNLK